MAYAIGTASGFIDMLKKLRDFADGTLDPTGTMGDEADFSAGVAVPTAEQWVVEAETIPESGNASDGEVFLRGPGGGSDNIYVNFQTYRDTGLFNWGIRGALGYSAMDTYATQLQTSKEVNFALTNATMDVWFYVNGFRIMAVAQIGSNYTCMYAGFFNQYATAAQYPYPMIVGASVNSRTIANTDNTYYHSCMPDPPLNGAVYRWADGNWYDVENYTSTTRSKTENLRTLWPYTQNFLPGPAHSQGTHVLEADIAPAGLWGFSAGASSLRLSSAFTGDKTFFPVVLHSDQVTDFGVIGELDGLYGVYGEVGDNNEDTVTVGSDTYRIFQNTWRTEPFDWFAVKEE